MAAVTTRTVGLNEMAFSSTPSTAVRSARSIAAESSVSATETEVVTSASTAHAGAAARVSASTSVPAKRLLRLTMISLFLPALRRLGQVDRLRVALHGLSAAVDEIAHRAIRLRPPLVAIVEVVSTDLHAVRE